MRLPGDPKPTDLNVLHLEDAIEHAKQMNYDGGVVLYKSLLDKYLNSKDEGVNEIRVED